MKTLWSVFVLAALCANPAAQSKSRQFVEQQSFGLGTDGPVVQHPVELSEAELAVLASDDLMRKELDQVPPITKLTRKGLETAVVHLHGPNERDLVVVGSGAPFIGANVGPFWVIRDLPAGPEVVLRAITSSLDVQKTSFNEFRNVEIFAATGVEGSTTDFRFDGGKYVVHRQSSKSLGK